MFLKCCFVCTKSVEEIGNINRLMFYVSVSFLFFKHLFVQKLGYFSLVVQGVLDRPALLEKIISNYVSCYNPGILLMSMCRQLNL